jgi:hypothetical protein
VTNIRIVIADPRSERVPVGGAVNGHHLVVLADTAPTEHGGHRAVPLWLRVRGAKGELGRLLDPPAGDPLAIAGHWQETAARLLQAAGVAVTAVEIEPASDDVPELRSDTVTARVRLATAGGARHVLVSAAYGLALAAVAGAPVGVADEVMDRLAVPVQGGDVLAPFLPPAPGRPPILVSTDLTSPRSKRAVVALSACRPTAGAQGRRRSSAQDHERVVILARRRPCGSTDKTPSAVPVLLQPSPGAPVPSAHVAVATQAEQCANHEDYGLC